MKIHCDCKSSAEYVFTHSHRTETNAKRVAADKGCKQIEGQEVSERGSAHTFKSEVLIMTEGLHENRGAVQNMPIF